MTPGSRIPELAFGHARRIEFNDPDRMAEGLAPPSRALLTYRQLDKEKPFLCRAAMVKTELTRVVASASSAVEVDADAPSFIGTLLLPLQGSTVARFGGRTVEWGEKAGPAFLPADHCLSRATERSVIGIDIDPVVTASILRAMLGDVGERSIAGAIDHRTPRVLREQAGVASHFEQLLLHHIGSFNLMNCDARLVQRSGLDDTIMRTALLLMNPELLLSRDERMDRSKAVVDLVCDYIEANLAERITLTDLERVSGYSARRLQYAFRSALDRTPMQWVADRRLEAVRKRILTARPDQTITEIASEFFSNLGDFARIYKLRYGESPSRTLQNLPLRRPGS